MNRLRRISALFMYLCQGRSPLTPNPVELRLMRLVANYKARTHRRHKLPWFTLPKPARERILLAA